MPWVYDPQSGGVKIPPRIQEELRAEVESFARTRSWYPRIHLSLRFKNQFFYIDMIEEGDGRPFPLCRLRHFTKDRWSLALFTYSHERYEPCVFSSGKWEGRVEEAIALCEPFIN